jgi:hypothetical protein
MVVLIKNSSEFTIIPKIKGVPNQSLLDEEVYEQNFRSKISNAHEE